MTILQENLSESTTNKKRDLAEIVRYPDPSAATVDDDLSGIPLKSFRALKPRKSHLSRLPLKSSKAMFLNENMWSVKSSRFGFLRPRSGRKKKSNIVSF